MNPTDTQVGDHDWLSNPDTTDMSIGVFIARGKEDMLVTKNLVPGESVYGERRISVEVCIVT